VGTRFACKVGTCIQSYLAKWLLNKHLLKDHNLAIEGRKYVCPPLVKWTQDAKIIQFWMVEFWVMPMQFNDGMSRKLLPNQGWKLKFDHLQTLAQNN
jgi:hypothetical protein